MAQHLKGLATKPNNLSFIPDPKSGGCQVLCILRVGWRQRVTLEWLSALWQQGGAVPMNWTLSSVQRRTYYYTNGAFLGNTDPSYQSPWSNLYALWRRTSHPSNLSSYCVPCAAPSKSRYPGVPAPSCDHSCAKVGQFLQKNSSVANSKQSVSHNDFFKV